MQNVTQYHINHYVLQGFNSCVVGEGIRQSQNAAVIVHANGLEYSEQACADRMRRTFRLHF